MIAYINRFNAAKGVVELHRLAAPGDAPQPQLLALLKRWGEKMTGTRAKLAALDKIIAVVRAYLPPDGMSAEQFISTVIEAVDNPEFNEAVEAEE